MNIRAWILMRVGMSSYSHRNSDINWLQLLFKFWAFSNKGVIRALARSFLELSRIGLTFWQVTVSERFLTVYNLDFHASALAITITNTRIWFTNMIIFRRYQSRQSDYRGNYRINRALGIGLTIFILEFLI